ncbi:Uma2 family endonuclease [Gordonia neofelifaecis]|nr:Uma2 family endonuclease [Gordonia neofelifaecis]
MTSMTTQILGLPRGRPLTRADLDAMPDDGHRYELVDGALIVSPAPGLRHQRAVVRLCVALVAACPDGTEVLTAPFDVVLGPDTVIQPDLLMARTADLTDRELAGPPLLAVEVLSPSTRGIDLLLKKDRLARARCPHYWVVDPLRPAITAWRLVGADYVTVAEVMGDDEFRATDPVDVVLVPADLTA